MALRLAMAVQAMYNAAEKCPGTVVTPDAIQAAIDMVEHFNGIKLALLGKMHFENDPQVMITDNFSYSRYFQNTKKKFFIFILPAR